MAHAVTSTAPPLIDPFQQAVAYLHLIGAILTKKQPATQSAATSAAFDI
ncbi:MAG: hypothetical protein OEY05_02510 [Paracoccaceae bacterium]|nr:hypothetical protein [Paracoccaceae bacterium]